MVRGCWRSPCADQGRGWSALEGCGGSHRGTADCRPLGVTRERACDVDMREVSCRPVRSEEEMLTGAPRCNLILTFLSRSIPVCEVGVRGVGGATSCVPLGLPELEGIMPRAAGFRPCRNLSSRSLRSLSGSSAALFAPNLSIFQSNT